MNSPLQGLKVVNRTNYNFPEENKDKYHKETHPEIASLAELAADFSTDRPLIDDFGKSKVSQNKMAFSKSDIDRAVVGCVLHKEKSTRAKFLLYFSFFTMSAIAIVYITLAAFTINFSLSSGSIFYDGISSGGEFLPLMAKGLYALFSALLCIGMIKAIIVKRPKKASYEITQEEEPILFYYIETICKSLNTPIPSRIFLSCDVDVKCRYKNHFNRQNIDVYIGLPLVSGFSTKELAGILAHELCRFNKNNNPYLGETVRSFYVWMGQISCHKDSLDEYIYFLNKKMKHKPFKLPLRIVQLFFKVPRWILHALMWVTHLICQFAIYKIDFECDHYEMQVAGYKNFEEIAYNMEMMNQTCARTYSGLDVAKKNKTLYEDLPGHIAATTVMLNEEKQQIIDKFKNRKERITGIHPAFKKRVDAAQKIHTPGIFNLDQPAIRLFLHLKQHKKHISIEQYKIHFGSNGINLESLKPTEVELRDMNELSRDWSQLENFFYKVISFEHIPVVGNKHSLSAKNWIQALRDLKQSHEKIKLKSYNIEQCQEDFEQILNLKRLLNCAKNYFTHNKNTHIAIDVMSKRVTRKNIERIIDATNIRYAQNNARLNEFHDLCSARICYAIQLLNRKEFRSKIHDGEAHRKNLSHILIFLRIFDHIKDSLLNMRNNFVEVKFLIESNESNYELEQGLQSSRKLLHKCLKNIILKLRTVPHPFCPDEESKSIMDHIGLRLPDVDNFTELLYVAEETYEKSSSIYFKVLAKLIFIVEEIEVSAGLEGPKSKDEIVDLSRTCG